MRKTALLIACAGLIVGIGMAAPKPAEAGVNISFGIGRGHYGGYGGYGYNRGYSSRGFGYNHGYYNRSFYGGGFGRSHYGGGHYHYNPPVVVPHGNHYHVIPGDRDFHRGGHYGHHWGH